MLYDKGDKQVTWLSYSCHPECPHCQFRGPQFAGLVDGIADSLFGLRLQQEVPDPDLLPAILSTLNSGYLVSANKKSWRRVLPTRGALLGFPLSGKSRYLLSYAGKVVPLGSLASSLPRQVVRLDHRFPLGTVCKKIKRSGGLVAAGLTASAGAGIWLIKYAKSSKGC